MNLLKKYCITVFVLGLSAVASFVFANKAIATEKRRFVDTQREKQAMVVDESPTASNIPELNNLEQASKLQKIGILTPSIPELNNLEQATTPQKDEYLKFVNSVATPKKLRISEEETRLLEVDTPYLEKMTKAISETKEIKK